MADGVRQLVYLSHARGEPSGESLAALERAAAANNVRGGVTGFLLYHDRRFIQLIEGDAAAIGALFDRIVADARHYDVLVVYDAMAEGRLAADWGMRSLRLRCLGDESDPLAAGELRLIDELVASCEAAASAAERDGEAGADGVCEHLRGVRFLLQEEHEAWWGRAG